MGAPRRVGPAVLLLAAGVVACGLFLAFTDEVFESGDVGVVDAKILVRVASWRTPTLDLLATDVTALGSVTLTALVVAIAFAASWLSRDRLGALQVAIVACGAGGAEAIAKLIFARPRPTVVPHLVEVSGYSYPSGHSLTTAAVYATLAILVHRRAPPGVVRTAVVVGAGVVTAAVASSRVYLGVHNPSDVAAGVLAGLGWAFLVAAAFSWRRSQLDD